MSKSNNDLKMKQNKTPIHLSRSAGFCSASQFVDTTNDVKIISESTNNA